MERAAVEETAVEEAKNWVFPDFAAGAKSGLGVAGHGVKPFKHELLPRWTAVTQFQDVYRNALAHKACCQPHLA